MLCGINTGFVSRKVTSVQLLCFITSLFVHTCALCTVRDFVCLFHYMIVTRSICMNLFQTSNYLDDVVYWRGHPSSTSGCVKWTCIRSNWENPRKTSSRNSNPVNLRLYTPDVNLHNKTQYYTTRLPKFNPSNSHFNLYHKFRPYFRPLSGTTFQTYWGRTS